MVRLRSFVPEKITHALDIQTLKGFNKLPFVLLEVGRWREKAGKDFQEDDHRTARFGRAPTGGFHFCGNWQRSLGRAEKFVDI